MDEEMAGVTKASFGKLRSGEPVDIYTLTNKNGLSAKIITYGATLTSVMAPDKSGKLGEVCLGFDNIAAYEFNGKPAQPYMGATVGRYANRIGKGRFTIGGKTYKLATNNPPNHLHGGESKALCWVNWKAQIVPRPDGPAVQFTYLSKDGDEGYPGNVNASVIFTLTEANTVKMEYAATTDKPCPINLTNHAYFNLKGSGTILDHELYIAGKSYTEGDDDLLPTGKILPVTDTPYDFFTQPAIIGDRINAAGGKEPAIGYDLNYVLLPGAKGYATVARVHDHNTGRLLEVRTDQPGIQFYTGNFLDGTLVGRGGWKYVQYSGFCLETQHFPDSPNQKSFPNTILQPGQTYRTKTEYAFLVK
ncbi:aldose epimerase family protein [Armatimonas rosea]|uniref:Aldose 1-epimerase n=1 Tax=Armatimonas rosea TaxID=685828 RepID=A0A7W9SSM3_ARMRO|nr:aldose epimerase family protein [Armatimonas rosea]MBB6052122.1 aldose 1-epimerase [Armatimonas rosea]